MYSIQQLDWSMKNSQIPINFEVRCIGFTTDRDIHRDSPGKLNTLSPSTYFNYFNTRNTSLTVFSIVKKSPHFECKNIPNFR